MKRTGILFVLVATAACTAAYGQFEVPWFTVDGGGAMNSTGGSFAVSGTIGQPDAGTMSGGGYVLSGGFWVSSVTGGPASCGCGDLDQDGIVNLIDFTTFASCFGLTGPEIGCDESVFSCADLNGDNVVNLTDFSLFSTAFGLPPVGNPPNCQ